MNATRNHTSNTTITRLIPFAFALMLVATSLATTGCDTLDSNAVEDQSPHVMFSSKSGEPHMLAAQDFQYTGSVASDLDGTWELVSENAAQTDRVTFSTSATQEEGKRFIGQYSGETTCSDFSGDFRAKNPQLETNMVSVAAVRCNVFVEEAVITMLRRATGYTLNQGRLLIFAGQAAAPVLVFQPVKTQSEDDGKPQLLGPPVPADDDPQLLGPPVPADDDPQLLGPPVPADDDPYFLGPPVEDNGEGQKEG